MLVLVRVKDCTTYTYIQHSIISLLKHIHSWLMPRTFPALMFLTTNVVHGKNGLKLIEGISFSASDLASHDPSHLRKRVQTPVGLDHENINFVP